MEFYGTIAWFYHKTDIAVDIAQWNIFAVDQACPTIFLNDPEL